MTNPNYRNFHKPHEGKEVEAPLEHYDTTLTPLPLTNEAFAALDSAQRGHSIFIKFPTDPGKEKMFAYAGRKEVLGDGTIVLHGIVEGNSQVNAALSYRAGELESVRILVNAEEVKSATAKQVNPET